MSVCVDPSNKRKCDDLIIGIEDSVVTKKRKTDYLICLDNVVANDSITNKSLVINKSLKKYYPIQGDLDSQEADLLKLSPEISFRCIVRENLRLQYGRIFQKTEADRIFQALEKQIEYFSGDLLKVRVYGKWHNVPRKQVCYGDPGLTYTFSGNCFPARPWDECSAIKNVKKHVESLCQHPFNFVLVNRYKDGEDYMGEHRDDEKDLVPNAPIASVSFGQVRDFIFKHKDARGTKHSRNIPPVTLQLEHGSLLIMQWPTNQYWYHSLPKRAKARNVRINLTFRHMVVKQN